MNVDDDEYFLIQFSKYGKGHLLYLFHVSLTE